MRGREKWKSEREREVGRRKRSGETPTFKTPVPEFIVLLLLKASVLQQ